MARVGDIRLVSNKPINPQSITYMDIGMDQKFFSIWTYRQSDPDRVRGASQNIQFTREDALILYKELGEFINM